MTARRRPFAAITLDIFDHALFEEHRAFSKLEAWLWLVVCAAWKPGAVRRSGGNIHVARGQIAATIRGLAATWGWPKIKVERWLAALAGEGMIALGAVTGTRNRTGTRIEKSYRQTLITICNYDKYQMMTGRAQTSHGGQVRGQVRGQEFAELPLALGDSTSPPTHHINLSPKRKGSPDRGEKPPHGAKGRGMVWIDHETPEWVAYADNFREATGADKLPETRIGGRGNWFRYLGEKRKA